MEAKSAVTQVPMLAPKDRAMPAGRLIRPREAITITTAVVAEEDCTRAVKAAPARMPSRGSSMCTIHSRKGS